MTSPAIVRWRNMADAIGVRRKAIAFFKTGSAGVIRVVDGDRVPAVFSHDGKAGDIGWPISDVDHVRKRDRACVIWHVVIDILRHVEQPLVDSEKILSLLCVADDTFW